MKKKISLGKRLAVLMMVVALCFAIAVPASATEVTSSDTSPTPTALGNSRAISGTASTYFDGSASFTIYSPGWSLWGQAMIVNASESTASAYVQIIGPNGQNCIPGGGVYVNRGQVLYQRLTNTGSGTYTIYVSSAGRGAVGVTLQDA